MEPIRCARDSEKDFMAVRVLVNAKQEPFRKQTRTVRLRAFSWVRVPPEGRRDGRHQFPPITATAATAHMKLRVVNQGAAIP
jgi:hypothetical protein